MHDLFIHVFITNPAVVDGGYTQWSEWEDCSNMCGQATTKTRTCTAPTPCNGGTDCSLFGQNTLTKTCSKSENIINDSCILDYYNYQFVFA